MNTDTDKEFNCPMCGKTTPTLKSVWFPTNTGTAMKIPVCSKCEIERLAK
jgi:transcription elongation factor Elf1